MRVDKDVKRTDCSHPFFGGAENPNVAALRRILLTYSMYNFDLGYCQVRMASLPTRTASWSAALLWEALHRAAMKAVHGFRELYRRNVPTLSKESPVLKEDHR